MGRSTIEALGHTRDQAERMIDAFTDMDCNTMLIAAEHYDPALPLHENDAYMTNYLDVRAEWEADLTARLSSIMAERRT